jgi:hypothetical protein
MNLKVARFNLGVLDSGGMYYQTLEDWLQEMPQSAAMLISPILMG